MEAFFSVEVLIHSLYLVEKKQPGQVPERICTYAHMHTHMHTRTRVCAHTQIINKKIFFK